MTETEMKTKLEHAEEQTHLWRVEAYDYAHQIARLRSQVARLEAELNLAQAKLALAGAR
ncbi:MAG: hypothetical protein KGN78_05025 [Actinomycetales bacterium]|nr:hypothetical protein [Actinomycetales bacterium]